MRRFILVATILSLNGFANHQKEDICPDGKRRHRATIRHIESGGIGYREGYTTLELFLAADPSDWRITPFLDLRGHVFDNGKWAANGGIGIRGLWGSRAYGINTYYDYRNTSHLNANQIGLGLETLGKLFDFRMNGYLPLGTKTSNPYDSTLGTFSGNYLLLSQKYKSAMKGCNAEFGFHFGASESFDFYAAAGPYYFIGEVTQATWGGKARVSGSYKNIVTLEISDSYDRTFHNKCQGQIALNFPFGPKSKVKESGRTCALANTLNNRMLQSIDRQEIIVIDTVKKKTPAINPATGLPYFFVFVDNTSSSNGTYESPYPTFAQAQDNSSPNDIIYVFSGDGTTTGMDAGIALQANQKLWGSGISHSLQTTEGLFSIPPLSSTAPTITNTNVDTEGNAITLATNNEISGFTISSALNDGIFGALNQNLNVSFCTFENIATFPIEATFAGEVVVSVINNQFLDNVNGVSLVFGGPSTVNCSNNRFEGQTSVSNVPIEIQSNFNTLAANIENNLFIDNETGSIRFFLEDVTNAEISILNNTMTNNSTGAQSSLGSNIVVLSDMTIDHCAIVLKNNILSENNSNSLYLHTSGQIGTLEVTASENTMSNNGGSAIVLATPVDHCTFVATDNTMTGLNDNAIGVIASGTTITGNITIANNTITEIMGMGSGIAIHQDFSTLNLAISNNEINGCEGTGIISYASTGINSLTLAISDNAISNCENQAFNSASGLAIEQYTNLAASVTDNILSDNTGTTFVIGSTLTSPTVCLTLTGNQNEADYVLNNPGDGLFNLSPCNADSMNIGMITSLDTGSLTYVQSCPDAEPCGP